MKSLTLAVLVLCATTRLSADTTEKMIPTNQVVNLQTTPIFNETEVLKEIKDFATIPVLFPTIVKVELNKTYFASTNLQEGNKSEYSILISNVPGCNANYCAHGFVFARLKGEITKDESSSWEGDKLVIKEIKKTPIDLANNIKGFYTPAFTAASYVNPTIQWKYKDVLYTIRWPADQTELTQMANSAILAATGKTK